MPKVQKYIMECFSVKLNELYPEISGNECVLTCYLPSDKACPGVMLPAVLIMPGGGYSFVSDREGEPVALKFAGEGFAAFTLAYSVASSSAARFPAQLLQACFAMKHIKDNAENFGIDAEKVFAMGFSAGGHLCGSLGLMYGSEYVTAVMPDFHKARPAAILLCYPVVTSGAHSHGGSFKNLMPEGMAADVASLEKRVTESSPPAFIWHTFDDAAVPVMNPLLLAAAYAEKKVPLELHIFESGVHGLSLCDRRTAQPGQGHYINENAAVWFDLLLNYLKNKI